MKYLKPNASIMISKVIEGLNIKGNDYLDFEEFVNACLFRKYHLKLEENIKAFFYMLN